MKRPLNPHDYGAREGHDSINAFERCSEMAQQLSLPIEITGKYQLSRGWFPKASVIAEDGSFLELTAEEPDGGWDHDSTQFYQAVHFYQLAGGYCRNLNVYGSDRTRGIMMSQCHNFMCEGNEVVGCKGAGIQVGLSTDVTVRRNRVSGIKYQTNGTAGDCCYIGGSKGTRVSDNEFFDFERIGAVSEANGDRLSRDTSICNNLIYEAKNSDKAPNGDEFNAAWWSENTIGTTVIGNRSHSIDSGIGQSEGRVRHAAIGYVDTESPDVVIVQDNVIQGSSADYFGITFRGNRQPGPLRSVILRGNHLVGCDGFNFVGRYASISAVDPVIHSSHLTSKHGLIAFEDCQAVQAKIDGFVPVNCSLGPDSSHISVDSRCYFDSWHLCNVADDLVVDNSRSRKRSAKQ